MFYVCNSVMNKSIVGIKKKYLSGKNIYLFGWPKLALMMDILNISPWASCYV